MRQSESNLKHGPANHAERTMALFGEFEGTIINIDAIQCIIDDKTGELGGGSLIHLLGGQAIYSPVSASETGDRIQRQMGGGSRSRTSTEGAIHIK